MKPHELFAALMHLEGGSLPLARKMGDPGIQSKLYKFAAGSVAEPSRATAQAIAAYFKLPVDAIYDTKLATSIARERGITALAPEVLAAREKPRLVKSQEAKEIEKIAHEYRRMNAAERRHILQLMSAAKGGADPTDARTIAPTRGEPSARDKFEGDNSKLSDLDDESDSRQHNNGRKK